MKNRSKGTLHFRIGLVLIIISSVIYALLLVVPFLKVAASVKLALVPAIIVIGEVAFWAGAFFLGKELVRKYRSYLNPINWFRKIKGRKGDFTGKLHIRVFESSDFKKSMEIFEMGIETGNATFEKQVPDWPDWDTSHLAHSRFVAEIEGFVAGWVALSPVSKREAYKGVAEISIYINKEYWGRGIGSALMAKAVESSEEYGIWTLYSVVFPENESSVSLHKKFGFRVIGTRERISVINGIWRDTLTLERRSSRVGI